jgi:hypothetical protein
MIGNTQHRIKKSVLSSGARLCDEIEESVGRHAVRWYIGQVTSDQLVVEATSCTEQTELQQIENRYYPGKNVVVNLVPTGIGCSIGGFAGDAGPVTQLLAAAADYLVTHPNAVNASDFIGLTGDNILYTDGRTLDLFCRGLVDLHLPYSNKVGVIVEKSEPAKLDVIFNIVNAVRAVHGVDIIDVVVTEEPIGGRCIENKSGAFCGTVDNPRAVLRACDRLIAAGADAIAITSSVQDLPMDRYASHFEGEYANPVGGVEAIISYMITSNFHLPSAHAPLINARDFKLKHSVVDARGAGEFASTSGLACVLIGLRRAPQIKPKAHCRVSDVVNVNNVSAIVVPASCLGGIPVLSAQKFGIPVVAVRENRTILNVTREALGLQNVIEVGSYAEAAGTLLALNKGISPLSLKRPLLTYRF